MTATTLFDYPLEMHSLPSTVRTAKKREITPKVFYSKSVLKQF